LVSLSNPGNLDVLEQNYAYDLITPSKLMEKYVGHQVEIKMPDVGNREGQTVTATLLSTNDGYVYRIGDKIYLQPPGQVILPNLPPDLVAQPSLIWLLNATRRGTQTIEASYLTSGMSWHADYVVVSRKDNTRADITGWVTLKNESGISYPNAHLTLVAGNVHRAPQPVPYRPLEAENMAAAPEAKSQFTQQALFEYHSYDLGRRTTLLDNQSKQLSLLNASDVKTQKVYVFDGARADYGGGGNQPKVQVMLEFKNSLDNGLGVPLPKGRIRVYQEDANHQLQFIGEDAIDHTPKDEKVRAQLGDAFDIVGERRQTNTRVLSDRLREYSYEIVLRNHKNVPVTVNVEEHQWGDWRIVSNNLPYNKLSATDFEFPTRVPANGQAKVDYTIQVAY
ncbi:MAG TPA: DUF4139 domain-containing protein, partial [Oscillatoriaceae cyanobacterium]